MHKDWGPAGSPVAVVAVGAAATCTRGDLPLVAAVGVEFVELQADLGRIEFADPCDSWAAGDAVALVVDAGKAAVGVGAEAVAAGW